MQCNPDKDCEIDCTSTNLCTGKVLTCPISTTSSKYNCLIKCSSPYSCVRSSIKSSDSISVLDIQMSTNSSQYLIITANGTSEINVSCNGYSSCYAMEINTNHGNSLTMNLVNGHTNSDTVDKSFYALYGGELKVNNTQNVSLNFQTAYTSQQTYFYIDESKNVQILCNEEYACSSNAYYIYHGTSLNVQGYTDDENLPAFDRSRFSITGIKDVVLIASSGAINGGSFNLVNIVTFLLSIDGNGAALGTQWDVNSVQKIAINSWNATSYWLVNGTPLESEYICPNNTDCNIRVDGVISREILPVVCPMDSVSSGGKATTCKFYCASSYDCTKIHLNITDTTNAEVYLTTLYNPEFTVIARMLHPTDDNTALTMECDYVFSCMNSSIIVSGYDNVKIVCNQIQACQFTNFDISNFAEVSIQSNSQGLYQSTLSLSDGASVRITSQDSLQSGQALAYSDYQFYNIEQVYMSCGYFGDCRYSKFGINKVGMLTAVCGNDNALTGESCSQTLFQLDKGSSLDLTCQGGDFSCNQTQVYYNVDKEYHTSCTILCAINPFTQQNPNCYSMDIMVNNSIDGYDAISLTCQTESSYKSCQDVTLTCGTSQLFCECPVVEDDDDWYCDGSCGTEACPAQEHSSSDRLSPGAIAGIVLSVVFFILVVGYLVYKYYKKWQLEKQLLSPLKRTNSQSMSTQSQKI